MANEPSKFIAHYEAECGDSYEMWNFKAPSISLPCDECNDLHSYKFMYLEHRVWEWERVEEAILEEGGLGLETEI